MTPTQALMWPYVPPKYRTTITRAWEGAPSYRNAITAKCLECTGYQRMEIVRCTADGRPLWQYRPYGGGDIGPESTIDPDPMGEGGGGV